MSDIYPDLYDFNLKQSLAKFVRESEFVATHAYPVNFEDTQFNPKTYARWVSFEWVLFGARMASDNVFHAQCFNRANTDRFGKDFEIMIGRLKQTLAIWDGIAVYDYITTPATPVPLKILGDQIKMAIRFKDRTATMDGSKMTESTSPVDGISLVVLSYDIHVGRLHEIH